MQAGIRISSPWRTFGYTGASLPSGEAPDAAGFAATWDVAGDAESAFWQQRGWAIPDCNEAADKPSFDPGRSVGVELREAVPVYLMVLRTQKCGVLFLALLFLRVTVAGLAEGSD